MDPEGIYTEDICSDKTLLHRMQVTCVMQGYGEPNGSMVREVLLQFSSVALCPGRCSVAAGWLRASPLCWANRVPVLLLVTGTRPFLGPLGTQNHDASCSSTSHRSRMSSVHHIGLHLTLQCPLLPPLPTKLWTDLE